MSNALADYKSWIQNRADEIASEEYEQEFYDLPEKIRDEVYNKATEACKDAFADSIDAIRESMKFAPHH